MSVEFKLGLPEGAKLTQSAGSLFHGLLMQHVDRDYGDFLHRQNLKPFSQYVFYDRQRQGMYWRIATLNIEAARELLQPALVMPQVVRLEQKNVELRILDRQVRESTDYGALAEKYFADDVDATAVEYEFLTSCSFKTAGEYAIFPQPHLLLGSLVNKWNAFAEREKLSEEQLVRHLADELYVYGYNLKLQPYSVESVSIPAFRGTYTLHFKHNLMVKKIICMLADFARFSGVGIKASLGMGATSISLKQGGRRL
jgi:CRISPR-associated endoribonuclease Cas6